MRIGTIDVVGKIPFFAKHVPFEGTVEALPADAFVGEAEFVGEGGELGGGVVEEMEGGGLEEGLEGAIGGAGAFGEYTGGPVGFLRAGGVGDGGEVPTGGGGVGVGGEGDGEELLVADVAPVGVEEADGTVFEAGCGGGVDIAEGVAGARGEGEPGAGAGADVEGTRGRSGGRGIGRGGGREALSEEGTVGVEIVVGFVTPFQQRGVFRELGQQIGMVEDDVAPHLDAAAVGFGEGVAVVNPVDVHLAGADFGGAFLGAALAEVPGFIAADVEGGAGEVGEEFVVHVFEELLGRGVGGAESPRDIAPSGDVVFLEIGGFGFGEMAEGGATEDFFEVAKGGE